MLCPQSNGLTIAMNYLFHCDYSLNSRNMSSKNTLQDDEEITFRTTLQSNPRCSIHMHSASVYHATIPLTC